MSQWHPAWHSSDVGHRHGTRVGIRGGYIPGGCTGAIPGTTLHRARKPLTSGAGPGSPAGAGVGGLGAGRVPPCSAAGDGSWDHPSGPVGAPGPLPVPGPLECRLWPITARFHDISQKLSKNGHVSPKYVEKACHSPCIPKWVQKVTS